MKRRICFIMCFILIFLLTACHPSQDTVTTPTDVPAAYVVNPVRTVNGADDFPNDLRFYMIPPENAKELQHSIIFAEIAQIKFVLNSEQYTLRGTYKEGDNSGVYGPFEETGSSIALDHKHGSCQISIRYTTEGVAVADWTLPPMTFSLSSGQNTDRDAFSQLVTQMASSQLDANYTLTQGNLQQQFADMACDSPIRLTVSGKTYTPYAAVVYSTFWDGENMVSADGGVRVEDLKQADILPAVPYSSDFTVSFTNEGELDIIILYDENFQRLEDSRSFDVFSQLTPGTYYVQAVVAENGEYIPKADRTECTGIACVFELTVE